MTACHAGDYHFVKATCASVRHFLPNVPLCVIVDGDLNVDELIETYNPYIIRTSEIEDYELRTYCSGSPRSKHLAMWLGPFERYVYLDSDAIFWGDVIASLKWEDDEDFIVFWNKPTEPAHNSWLSHFYFDIDILKLYDPEFEWKWNPYFSAGSFASRRVAISFEDFKRCESWRSEYPNLFSWTTDQGILNYLVFSLIQRGKLKLGRQYLQWIPAHRGIQ
ncbi:MAG: hypothetical protein F6K50_39555 [Moorea sp. SIO3I7]|nr:hypothetical protein [Moorena sp. SIO3I7]